MPCKVLDGDSESTSEQTKPLRYHDCTLLETDSIPKQELTIIETQEIRGCEEKGTLVLWWVELGP